MDLTQIKQFLKIDYDDDDEYITLLIRVAEEYIADAVDNPNKESARYELLLKFIVSTLYENRIYTVDQANEKVSYTIRSMTLQMQLGDK